MDVLAKLFGSTARVKILRLFLFNPDTVFDKESVMQRAQISSLAARQELSLLLQAKLLKQKSFYKLRVKKRGASSRTRVSGFILNADFPYRKKLQELLLNAPLKDEEIIKKLAGAGSMRLIVTAGLFLQDWENRIDLLIVGDRVDRKRLNRIILGMEAEIGKELRFVVLSTHEFQYRLGIYDRLVRDVLDYPHTKILNKLNI